MSNQTGDNSFIVIIIFGGYVIYGIIRDAHAL